MEITISKIQDDWRILDDEEIIVPKWIRLISHEKFSMVDDKNLPEVHEIRKHWISKLFSFSEPISNIIWAFQILLVADKNTVILANGSSPIGNYICMLNYFFLKKHTILFWDSHIEPVSKVKKYFARFCFLGSSLSTFWSKKQPENYVKHFNIPIEKLCFLPYKANHSKFPKRSLPSAKFVFAGGNGKRDYKTLVEAVRNTDVVLIISATKDTVRKEIPDLPNVIPLAATEPSFAKLMAMSNFVVIPMASTGLKGGGEANFCNAMWHGKAIVAMDDTSAQDYILDGETGYIVPPKNSILLRKKILTLWESETKCLDFGNKGRQRVKKYFTHKDFIKRLIRTAIILGIEELS